MKYPSKDQVLKLGIGICSVLILFTLSRNYISPVYHSFKLERADKKNFDNLQLLNSAIAQEINKLNGNLKTNTVYISVPSDEEDCSDIELPILAKDWRYHCASNENYRSTDGKGWIPMVFSDNKNALNKQLPIDNENNHENLRYFSFVANSSSSDFALTGMFDSAKYIADHATQDKGADSIRLELGNNISLWAISQGITSYWTQSEDTKSLVSKNVNTLNETEEIITKHPRSIEECVVLRCLKITKENRIISTSSTSNFSTDLDGAYSFLFKITSAPQYNSTLYNPGTDRLDVNIEGKTGALFVWLQTSTTSGRLVYKSPSQKYTDNKWHAILINKRSNELEVYIDRTNVASIDSSSPTVNDLSRSQIAINGFSSPEDDYILMDDLKNYNRNMNITEIKALYSRMNALISYKKY